LSHNETILTKKVIESVAKLRKTICEVSD